ncbi:hypothetical protein [Streptomyces sp. 2A115]|uniref:hypothetical protein n=1 Tax=Streptomyces sp. 2A115 TaxID=3457439 RepID=UPI003FD15915
MAVFGFLEWCRGLLAARFVAAGEPSGAPPETTADPGEDGTVPIDDSALKAYAMQRREWAEALIDVESARVDGEIRLLAVRLLLGTACGSILLFSIAVSARIAPSLRMGSLTPLTTTVLGALGAAVVTALAAGVGKVLRGRSEVARSSAVSGPQSPAGELPPEPGSGPGDAP